MLNALIPHGTAAGLLDVRVGEKEMGGMERGKRTYQMGAKAEADLKRPGFLR